MSEVTTVQAPRVRVNAHEVKAGWQFDVTVETFNGEDAPALLVSKIGEVKQLFAAKRLKIASDAE